MKSFPKAIGPQIPTTRRLFRPLLAPMPEQARIRLRPLPIVPAISNVRGIT